jgi:hypothetical protein
MLEVNTVMKTVKMNKWVYVPDILDIVIFSGYKPTVFRRLDLSLSSGGEGNSNDVLWWDREKQLFPRDTSPDYHHRSSLRNFGGQF